MKSGEGPSARERYPPRKPASLHLLCATPHYIVERLKREQALRWCPALQGRVLDVGLEVIEPFGGLFSIISARLAELANEVLVEPILKLVRLRRGHLRIGAVLLPRWIQPSRVLKLSTGCGTRCTRVGSHGTTALNVARASGELAWSYIAACACYNAEVGLRGMWADRE